MAIPQFSYRKITKENIFEFMDANATEKEKADFKETAFELKKKYTMVPKINPLTGKQVINRRKVKNSNPPEYHMIPAMERVEIVDSEAEPTYNHRKAVEWFVATYEAKKAIVVNDKPKAKKQKEDKKPASELFANW